MLRTAFAVSFSLSLLACTDDSSTQAEIKNKDYKDIARATARFHSTHQAQAAGWDLLPGLDHCFNNPGVGAMGYHYINAAKLDLTVERLAPEAMVYYTGDDGELHLGAVEYIVPAEPWDAAHPGEHPMALDMHMHLNAALGVYVLHLWLWKDNPLGILEDWNPDVTCP